MSAHSVANHEQGVKPRLVAPDDYGVLVLLTLETGIGRPGDPKPHQCVYAVGRATDRGGRPHGRRPGRQGEGRDGPMRRASTMRDSDWPGPLTHASSY